MIMRNVMKRFGRIRVHIVMVHPHMIRISMVNAVQDFVCIVVVTVGNIIEMAIRPHVLIATVPVFAVIVTEEDIFSYRFYRLN